jgi:hypothetical protein
VELRDQLVAVEKPELEGRMLFVEPRPVALARLVVVHVGQE